MLRLNLILLFILSLFSPAVLAGTADDACFHNVIRDALNKGKTMTDLGPWLDKSYNFSQQKQPEKDLPNMVNDSGLRNSAAIVASSCVFAHSGLNGIGENLFVGTEPPGTTQSVWQGKRNWSMKNAVHDWAYEVHLMVFTNGDSMVGCNDGSSGSGCRSKIGHYTQMMWDDTTNVGCASQFCPNGVGNFSSRESTLIVCHYSPQGNYVQSLPEGPFLAPYTTGGFATSSAAPLSGCNDGVDAPPPGSSGGSGSFDLTPILMLLNG